MEKVTVSKGILLSKVRQNREKHVTEFVETMEGYRQMVIDELDGALSCAHEEEDVDFADLFKLARKPESHEKDYDRAIAMLEMSTDGEITLTKREFDQLVMDEWDWKADFSLTGALYNSKLK